MSSPVSLPVPARVALGLLILAAGFGLMHFLAPVAGVFVDRWDRRRVMVTCDVGRGLVLAVLPFARTIPVLVAAIGMVVVINAVNYLGRAHAVSAQVSLGDAPPLPVTEVSHIRVVLHE